MDFSNLFDPTVDPNDPNNTRPRYVNPPMVDPTAAPNPAMLPGNPQQADPYTALQQVLSNLNPNIAPPPQESTLQKVLNMIANGVAVGISNDPGATLMKQIKDIQDEKNQRYLLQQQRNNKIEDLTTQVALQKAADQIKQQQQIAAEQRQRGYKLEDRRLDLSEELDKEQRALNVASIKRDWNNEDQEKDLRLRKDLEAEYLGQDIDRATALNNVQQVDARRAAQDKKLIELQMSGLTYDQANAISQKYISGDPLTPEESKWYNKALAFSRNRSNQEFNTEQKLKAAQAYHYTATGDAALAQKRQLDKMDTAFDTTLSRKMADLAEETFYLMKDGTMRPASQFPLYKQMGVLPPGALRVATQAENIGQQAKLYEAYRKDAEARKASRAANGQPVPDVNPVTGQPVATPTPQAVPTPNAQPGQPPTANENLRMQVGTMVSNAMKQGMSADEVNRNLDISIKEDPANAQIYEGFKIRTAQNTVPTGTPNPQAAPLVTPTPQGTTVEDYLKKRRDAQNKASMFGGGEGPQIRKVTPEEKAILDQLEKNRQAFEKAKAEYNRLHGNTLP